MEKRALKKVIQNTTKKNLQKSHNHRKTHTHKKTHTTTNKTPFFSLSKNSTQRTKKQTNKQNKTTEEHVVFVGLYVVGLCVVVLFCVFVCDVA